MLYTIGYEKARLEYLIGTLQHCDIEVLVDIRDRAQSRRPGFSKTALSEALSEHGISYLHFRELGDPKPGRDAARAGRYDKFIEIYERVLETSSARAAIQEIATSARTKNVCLLCYERSHRECHRALVADRLEVILGRSSMHLGVQPIAPERPMRDHYQSATAS